MEKHKVLTSKTELEFQRFQIWFRTGTTWTKAPFLIQVPFMQQHFLFRLAAGIKYGLKRKICSFDNEEKTYFKLLKSAAVREAFINVQPVAIPVNFQVKIGYGPLETS